MVMDNQLCCTANITNPADLQDSLQHPQDPALPHDGSSTTPVSTTAIRSWLDSLPPRPLQRIQNPAACPMYNIPKFSHVTPLFHVLHWLPVVARIRFKTMVLTYKAVNRTAPTYLQVLVRPHALAGPLCSTTSAGRLVLPSLRASEGRIDKSQLFSVLAPLWWNELPADIRTAPVTQQQETQDSPGLTSRVQFTWTLLSLLPLKAHLFRVHLDSAEPPSSQDPPVQSSPGLC